jgi:hypothetical protein
MGSASHDTFRGWLSQKLVDEGVPRRELARRMASKHPAGVNPQTIETFRRAIYRYLDDTDPMRPNEQTRAAVAEAFGVDPSEIPDDTEEEPDLAAALRMMAAQNRTLTRQLRRMAKERVA